MDLVEESLVEQALRGLLDGLPALELDCSVTPGHVPTEPFGWPDPPARLEAAARRGWQEFCRSFEQDGQGGPAAAGAAPDAASGARAGSSHWAVPGSWEEPAPAPARDAGCSSRTVDPGPEVAALSAALDAVAAQDAGELPEAQALARARWLLQATERMKALSVEALAEVETRTLHRLDDAPSVTAWVAGLAVPGVEGRDITLARRLRRVPQVHEELKAGRMSARTAAALTSAISKARAFLDRPDGLIDGLNGEQVLHGVLVDGVCSLLAEQVGGAAEAEQRLAALRAELTGLNDPARTQLARWEAALMVFARDSDPSLLTSGLALLVDALLPNEHDKRARAAQDDSGLDLHRHPAGSGWSVKGELDDQTGEMLATVLHAAAATDPAGPVDTSTHAAGRQALDDDTLPPDQWPVDQPTPRSRRRQRHDAFKRGLQALLDSGTLGVRGKVAPHVAVTVGLDFLHGAPGSLPARTEHAARLSREQTRRLLCHSTFTRLVLNAQRRVVQTSHTQPTSTALERLILKVQGAAVCSGAGCARGPATGHRLIPHHASLFSTTGTTDLSDTVLICENDHDHQLHSKERTLLLKDGRILGPHGWIRR